jgi:hypothetical protein
VNQGSIGGAEAPEVEGSMRLMDDFMAIFAGVCIAFAGAAYVFH